MRSFELLVRDYPNLLGSEILELHKKELAEEEARVKKRLQALYDLRDDINNGNGFYKGEFGLSQKFMYKFTNAKVVSSGALYADVEKIILFENFPADRTPINIMHEVRLNESLDTYGLSTCQKIGKHHWKKVKNELDAIVRVINLVTKNYEDLT